MPKDFHQIAWDDSLEAGWAALLRLAIAEDFGSGGDWTTNALVAPEALGRARVVVRQAGVIAGLPGVGPTLAAVESRLRWSPQAADGQRVAQGQCVGTIEGPARGLLGAERILLNLLGRLSGIATLARQYVDAVAGTKARIYDTRKTTPGWRRLEKYATGRGGAQNHRGSLSQALLIKDNHLALVTASPAEAVARAREFVRQYAAEADPLIEVEVDRLDQLEGVLPARPDIVLLDNMTADELLEAVALRDAVDPAIELEASGGVSLATVRAIAETGVDRISVGALTHSAPALDIGLDWA
jgi:nicotinate-nucleotide pyrophosphorylase (carboxylating)